MLLWDMESIDEGIVILLIAFRFAFGEKFYVCTLYVCGWPFSVHRTTVVVCLFYLQFDFQFITSNKIISLAQSD